MEVRKIVVHTAAADIDGVDVAAIDRWHREKGWSQVGYHYVIIDQRHGRYPDGMIQHGRPESMAGAHALGLNDKSLGVCCAGHGDLRPFTGAQTLSLVYLCASLAIRHGLGAEDVIGHREIDAFGGRARGKTCPGKRVDLSHIRHLIGRAMSGWEGTDMRGEIRERVEGSGR